MQIFKQYILFTTLLASLAVVADEQVPPSFKATYKLYYSGMEVGETERSISMTGNDEYIYRSESRTVGLAAVFRDDHIVEQSQWRVIERQIYPLDYSYVRTGKKDREVMIHFDWDNNLITSRVKNKTRETPLESGVLDKLLYQYAIMRDLQNGHFPKSYMIADGGKSMQIYNFDRMGEEKVNTPLGDLNTIKVQNTKPNDTRKLVFWFAPELKYMPVKIEHTEEDGSITTAVIQGVAGI
jgi:hypothetical protein